MIGAVAIAVALSLTACSEDSTDPPKTTHTTSAKPSASTNLPPVPTAAELNQQLQRALDPAVPAAEKLDGVQGAEADPELPNRLAEAAAGANVQIEVTDVTSFGDSVNAKAKFIVNGQENIVDVPFVAEDGKWKVQKQWSCTMLSNLGQQSVACDQL